MNNKKVSISGFGTFQTSERRARNYRNPQTGKIILSQATRRPKFTPYKLFKDAVKS